VKEPETPDQYRQRFKSYVQGKDPMAMQQEAIGTLERLTAGVPEEKLRLKPAPQKWSVLEIVAHLAEDELVTSWRYRQMIEHHGVALMGFDQDQWAVLGDYGAWNAREALQMFRLLRQANLRLLKRLTPEQWESHGNHAERGRITVRELALHMAAHDVNHILQIERLLHDHPPV
jgi:DinB family protein